MLLLSAAPWPLMGGVPPEVGERADTGDRLLSAERLPLACGGDMLRESDVAGDTLLSAARPLLGEGEGLEERATIRNPLTGRLPLLGDGDWRCESAGAAGDRLLLAVRPLLGEDEGLQEHAGVTRDWLGLLAARLPLLGEGERL